MASEQELAEAVVDWLNRGGWDVYQEVCECYGQPIADIIAVRGGITWAIECKKSLGLTVMDQASRWFTHFRSVAVPRLKGGYYPKRRPRIVFSVCEMLRIGIIEVGKHGDVTELTKAPLFRKHRADMVLAMLVEEHKTFAKAGSAEGGHFSTFRETLKRVENRIKKNPGCTMREIMVDLDHHYGSDSSAKACIRKWLPDDKVCPWCRVDQSGVPHRYYVKEARDGE